MRQVRYDLAQKHQVPPFIIFSDATLRALCRHFPTTETAFLTISGVGHKKLSQYGYDFMQAIEAYLAEKDQYKTRFTLKGAKRVYFYLACDESLDPC